MADIIMLMKKILSLVMLLAGVTMFTACGDDDPTYTAPAKLTIKSADAFYEATGGTGTIVVSSNEAITATTDANWLTVSVAGQTVTLTVSANDKLEGRSANINLKSASASAKVNITQKGIIYGVADVNGFEMADTLDSKASIPVAQTAGMTVTSLTDWLTATFNGETSAIDLVATANDTETDRVGYIAVKTGVIEDTIAVTQQGIVFVIDPATVSVPADSCSQTVTILHSRPLNVTDMPDWVTLKGADKDGVFTLIIDFNENAGEARTGEIVLTVGPIEKKIVLAQAEASGDNPQPTFADEVYGNYLFVYLDNQSGEWTYFDANISADGLTLLYPATETVTLPYVVPLEIDNANKVVKAGPNGSFLGMYGSSYYIYLGWYNFDSGMSGFDVSGFAEGTLSVEEEEGELTTYLDWAGTFGTDSIDIWVLQAFDAPEYAEANSKGALDYLIYPYMIKLGDEEPAAEAPRRAAALKAAKHRRPAPRRISGLPRKQKGLGALRTPWRK